MDKVIIKHSQKNAKREDISSQEQVKRRIERRFKRKPAGRIIINLKNKTKIRIEYMFGAKYLVRRKKGKSIVTLNFIADIDQVVDLIFKEKGDAENKIYNKLKGMKR